MAAVFTLFGSKGCGSAAIEAVMDILELPYAFVEASPWEDSPNSQRLREVNPLNQVPTLLLPDGRVMTESMAMLLYLSSLRPGHLAPSPNTPLVPQHLRWLAYVATNIYATITFGDHPEWWVEGKDAQEALKNHTVERVRQLWLVMESALRPAPYLLGETMCDLDIYVAMMSYWRPRRAWFNTHCPRLAAAVALTEQNPKVKAVFARNEFPTP